MLHLIPHGVYLTLNRHLQIIVQVQTPHYSLECNNPCRRTIFDSRHQGHHLQSMMAQQVAHGGIYLKSSNTNKPSTSEVTLNPYYSIVSSFGKLLHPTIMTLKIRLEYLLSHKRIETEASDHITH